jgi:hypothetical protein
LKAELVAGLTVFVSAKAINQPKQKTPQLRGFQISINEVILQSLFLLYIAQAFKAWGY